jgi:hypothetical protein
MFISHHASAYIHGFSIMVEVAVAQPLEHCLKLFMVIPITTARPSFTPKQESYDQYQRHHHHQNHHHP